MHLRNYKVLSNVGPLIPLMFMPVRPYVVHQTLFKIIQLEHLLICLSRNMSVVVSYMYNHIVLPDSRGTIRTILTLYGDIWTGTRLWNTNIDPVFAIWTEDISIIGPNLVLVYDIRALSSVENIDESHSCWPLRTKFPVSSGKVCIGSETPLPSGPSLRAIVHSIWYISCRSLFENGE